MSAGSRTCAVAISEPRDLTGINSRARALLYVLGNTQVSEGQEPNVVSASSKQQTAAASLPPSSPAGGQAGLKRTLTLTNAVLYGLGVTIGAGIYVLIGAAAARAGMYAPAAFVIAAVLMGLTAASFAELAGRMPVAAGEAAYVRAAFQSDRLATLVGLLAIAIAVVSAAAISVGSAGYVGVFLPLPEGVRITLVVLAMGAIAAWGIKESVVFAGVMTLIEVGGLLLLIAAGVWSGPELVTRLPEAVPPIGNPAVAAGLAGADPARGLRLSRLRGPRQHRRGGARAQAQPAARHLPHAAADDRPLRAGGVGGARRRAGSGACRFEGAAGTRVRTADRCTAGHHERDCRGGDPQRHHRAGHHVLARALWPGGAGQPAGVAEGGEPAHAHAHQCNAADHCCGAGAGPAAAPR